MLRVRFLKVKPDRVERLRAWMDELGRRHDEVVVTFAQETVRHEAAWRLETSAGPILVYAIEADDLVMSDVLEGPVDVEQLLDERA